MKRAAWGLLGAALGAVVATVVFAPAAWLADTLGNATGGRVLLADARGTVWQGSAVMVLTGGPGSRDASALPGRLSWTLGLDGSALALRARQPCCIEGELKLRVQPGLASTRVELPGPPAGRPAAPVGSWPASWLVGLGTPWNTLQPSGALLLSSRGLVLQQTQGRWSFSGHAELEMQGIATRVSTLPVLGSYRLELSGDAAGGGPARVRLTTISGALLLQGSGSLLGAGGGATSPLRFSGQASAAPGSEAVLANLLAIIGRRQGAVAVISIG